MSQWKLGLNVIDVRLALSQDASNVKLGFVSAHRRYEGHAVNILAKRRMFWSGQLLLWIRFSMLSLDELFKEPVGAVVAVVSEVRWLRASLSSGMYPSKCARRESGEDEVEGG